MGFSGYLFGQLFFGTFSAEATLAGLGGIGAALLWRPIWRQRQKIARGVVALSIIALVGFAAETYEFYRHLNIPGNDFAWWLRAPYLAGILWLAVDSARHLTSR